MLAAFLAIIGSPLGYIGGSGLLIGLVGFGLLLKWRRDVIWIVAVVAAAWIASGTIYRAGEAACQAKVTAAVAAENSRRDAEKARADAYQWSLVAGLLRDQERLAALIKENDDEAASDPDAAGCGLSRAGVLRYEKLRRSAD